MEEIAKIFKINKTGIMQTFIILIICSVAGNIIHDVIMLMENIGLVEKDYTVFPMGSFMVIIGIIAAVNKNRCIDYIIRLLSFLGNSMPNFFAAIMLIYIFALKLNLLPVMGMNAGIKSVILPAVTLAIAMSSRYIRQIRTAVINELQKDYVQGAIARGVGRLKIITGSVLKSSLLTIITLLALSIGSLLGGTAIVESIFMWDGVGKMAIDAITMRDYPVIQAYVIWMAIIYVVINLITDIVYHYLNPRTRLGDCYED